MHIHHPDGISIALSAAIRNYVYVLAVIFLLTTETQRTQRIFSFCHWETAMGKKTCPLGYAQNRYEN